MHVSREKQCAALWAAGFGVWLVVAICGDAFLLEVWNTTLALGLLAAAVAVPSGAALAWLLWRSTARGRTPALALTAAWLVMPLYLQAAAWKALFDNWTTPGSQASWQDGWVFLRACWVHAAHAIPWSTAAFSVALIYLPRNWEEQASLQVRPRRAWFAATWPVWLGAAAVTVMWELFVVTTDITVTDLFQVRTFAEMIYLQFAIGESPDFRPFGWESWFFLIWLVALLATTLRQARPPIGEPVERSWRAAADVTPSVWPTILLWLLLLVWLGVPAAVLARQAGTEYVLARGQWTAHWSHWKLLGVVAGIGPQRDQFVARQFESQWYWSAWITGLGAAITTLLASFLAWTARWRRHAGPIVLCVLAISAAIPGPQWGIWLVGLFTGWNLPWLNYLYDQTVAAPVMAGVIRALPLATLIWWLAFRGLPRHLCEAATLAGWGWLRQWCLLAVPARVRVIPWVALLAGAIVFADLGATLPVIPPGVLTITVRVFDLLHAGVDDLAAAICLLLALVVTAVTTLAVVLGSWKR